MFRLAVELREGQEQTQTGGGSSRTSPAQVALEIPGAVRVRSLSTNGSSSRTTLSNSTSIRNHVKTDSTTLPKTPPTLPQPLLVSYAVLYRPGTRPSHTVVELS